MEDRFSSNSYLAKRTHGCAYFPSETIVAACLHISLLSVVFLNLIAAKTDNTVARIRIIQS